MQGRGQGDFSPAEVVAWSSFVYWNRHRSPPYPACDCIDDIRPVFDVQATIFLSVLPRRSTRPSLVLRWWRHARDAAAEKAPTPSRSYNEAKSRDEVKRTAVLLQPHPQNRVYACDRSSLQSIHDNCEENVYDQVNQIQYFPENIIMHSEYQLPGTPNRVGKGRSLPLM